MARSSVEKAKIGHDFVWLRRLFGLTQRQVVNNSAGLLAHGEISRIERGRSCVSTAAKRRALAAGFGLEVDVVTALVEGRITAQAAYAARRNAQPLAATRSADVGSAAVGGDDTAIMTKLAHMNTAQFPKLELALLYHEQNGKQWSPSVVAAARAGRFGTRDTTPDGWAHILTSLESALGGLETAKDSSRGESVTGALEKTS